MPDNIDEQPQKGYGKCLDCDWLNKEEGCNVARGSKVCLLNVKVNPIDPTQKICEVEQYCKYRNCKEPDTQLQYITYSNCSCRRCHTFLTDKACDFSGESYNTDSDCLEKL
jgi:hypothetical protein